MACINVDNKATTDTNTGEESQASDIFKPVVGPWVGGESDQVVAVRGTAYGLVGRR